MRPQKIDDQSLLNGLMSVLISKGYDGSSLNELADSSGLKKPSLYHRFPGGKKDIGLAVLSFVGEWIDINICGTLKNSNMEPKERLSIAIQHINELYKEGKSPCILRALSMDTGLELFRKELAQAAKGWIDAFSKLGQDLGLSENIANKKALKVFSNIQGSLVASSLLNDNTIFKSTLKEIEIDYLDS